MGLGIDVRVDPQRDGGGHAHFCSDLLQALIFKKKLVPVSDTILFREQEFEQMKGALIQYLKTNDAITLAQFRDLFHTSRKFALAFLDYMDEQGVTVRVDDVRTLRHSG